MFRSLQFEGFSCSLSCVRELKAGSASQDSTVSCAFVFKGLCYILSWDYVTRKTCFSCIVSLWDCVLLCGPFHLHKILANQAKIIFAFLRPFRSSSKILCCILLTMHAFMHADSRLTQFWGSKLTNCTSCLFKLESQIKHNVNVALILPFALRILKGNIRYTKNRTRIGVSRKCPW